MLLLPAPLTPASTAMSKLLASSARPRLARCPGRRAPELGGCRAEEGGNAGPGLLRLHRRDELVETPLELGEVGAAIARQRLEVLDRQDDRARRRAPRHDDRATVRGLL